jgi:hypothetical protein
MAPVDYSARGFLVCGAVEGHASTLEENNNDAPNQTIQRGRQSTKT